MDSKQRATLRAEANTLPALFQIGKEGVTEAVCAQVIEGFNTRELMKVKCLLKTLPVTVREAAEAIANGSDSEVVQTIGGSIILYKYNPELHEKKKAAKPRPSQAKRMGKVSVVKRTVKSDDKPKSGKACATQRTRKP